MIRDRRDRRAPQARYVLFRDTDVVQPRFVALAEDAYTRLARADAWTTGATIELSTAPAPTRWRDLLRRPRDGSSTVRTTVTLVLAEAHRVAIEAPGAMNAIEGCAAGRRAASFMGAVLTDLVGQVATVPVPEQKTHPDYRQTMRLTAELTALCELTAELGCADPRGCVTLRKPEAGGRRVEDVEVTKVRAMLLRRGKAGAHG